MNLSKEQEEELRKKIGEVSGFVLNNGYRLVKLEKDYCEMEADITEIAMNSFNKAHGGFIFGLMDTAAGVAAMGDGKRVAVTSSSHIQYLRAVDCSTVKAIAKCIKAGRNISVYDVELYSDKEVLLTKATVEYFYIN